MERRERDILEPCDEKPSRPRAASLDALIDRLPVMVADLIEENGFEGGTVEEVALEVGASHGQRVALRDVA